VRIVELLPGLSPFERGFAHGSSCADWIAELSSIRSRLACEQGLFRSDAELLRVADLHLPILERFDPGLHDELRGIASGADLPVGRIVVLNHYTDLKDLDPRSVLGASDRPRVGPGTDENCSTIVAGTAEGAILGQTWDMHGSAAPFVIMLHVHATAAAPEVWLLSVAGCLGMTGMSSAGVGITINNLKSLDARVGLVWPALVRRCLAETSARAAAEIVLHAPRGSGHHYLVADRSIALGVETSGHRAEVWNELDLTRVGASFHHENHCLGREVAEVSTISPVSTTRERHAFLEASLRASPILGRSDLWARLGSHEGHPRSVCTHLASEAAPHAMATCAGIVMNLTERRLWAAAGCIHEVDPIEHRFAEAT
jgi:isopenicillin-N N-acyltransferase like protein